MNNVNCDFITGAANTAAGCVKWINHRDKSLVVFGLSNLVAIGIPAAKTVNRGSGIKDCECNDYRSYACISQTLRQHTARVTCVDYIASDDRIEIYSGSEDCTMIAWTLVDEEWVSSGTLRGWRSSIVSISVCRDDGHTFIVGADSTGTILVWAKESNNSTELILVEEFLMPAAQLPRTVLITTHFNANAKQADVLIFLGSVDTKIHIRTASSYQISRKIRSVQDSGPGSVEKVFKAVGSLSGHEEWITSLAIYHGSVYSDSAIDSSLTLASASQDSKIRLWRMTGKDSGQVNAVSTAKYEDNVDDDEDDELLDAQEGAVVLGKDEELAEIRLDFSNERTSWAVYLDALLIGHEDWVTSVSFMKTSNTNQSVRIFSTSMDRNMIIWSPDKITGAWIPMSRMGDIGGTLGGSVGQNLLGFVNGVVNDNGTALIGLGYGGSFHLWEYTSFSDTEGKWSPELFLTGHFASVNDFNWQPEHGEYIVTVSSDQTCRLFAPIADNESNHWKEISRPQIHGYDLNCVLLDRSPSYLLFSGSDEKVIRVFDAPSIVIDGLNSLCGISPYSGIDEDTRVAKAYIPELGLSNKAAEFMSKEELKEQAARGVVALDYSSAPLEGQLADHTIWPEVKKLFRHKNEVMCLAMSLDRSLMASACKARDAVTAKIAIWDMARMVCIDELEGHESTIVRLKFSPNSRLLVSVGKDRSIVLHHRAVDSSSKPFDGIRIVKAAHKRIIWDCCWTSTLLITSEQQKENCYGLLTAARDGSCKLWRITCDEETIIDVTLLMTFIPFDGTAITAIDSVSIVDGEELVVLGSELGDIQIYRIHISDDKTTHHAALFSTIPSKYCHGSTVKRLQWNPTIKSTSRGKLSFASCGEDNTVRIVSVLI